MNMVMERNGYVFIKENGNHVRLSVCEISFILHWFERSGWRDGFDAEIDNNEDSIDLTDISRKELIELCMDDLEFRWENGTLNDYCPDYEGILFDIAQENGIWRD